MALMMSLPVSRFLLTYDHFSGIETVARDCLAARELRVVSR
jgi:hypothetical protein